MSQAFSPGLEQNGSSQRSLVHTRFQRPQDAASYCGQSARNPHPSSPSSPIDSTEHLALENASLLSLVEQQQQCISSLRYRVSMAEREQRSLKSEVQLLKGALDASDQEIAEMAAQVEEVGLQDSKDSSLFSIFGWSSRRCCCSCGFAVCMVGVL